MVVDLKFVVEDVATKLSTYAALRIYRSSTLTGTYSRIKDITLVSGTYYYSYEDVGGNLNKWYKYSFYNLSGPRESDLSAPFRVDGVTRLRGRQAALAKYGAGVVLVNTGTDSDKITTSDYRVKTTLFRDNRGKGTWLWPATGNNAEKPRIILSSDVSAGSMTVLPTWASAFVSGDEVEWHMLADPTEWNNALNRGLARYWYVERVPIAGVANQEEYSLAGIPFLLSKDHVHDVRWYPTSGVDVDESYGVDGRWWSIREDVGVLTLQIKPAIGDSQTLYLETTRPMQSLYTDASAAPAVAAEELVAALAYDEVLAYLSAPGRGSVDARKVWREARAVHASELHRLLIKHRPKPRQGHPQSPWPTMVPQPWSAR